MPEPADLTLAEHEARAGRMVDRAIEAARSDPWRAKAKPEVAALRELAPDDLRSVVIVLLDRATEPPSMVERLRGVATNLPSAFVAGQVLASLGARAIPWTASDADHLLRLLAVALRGMARHEE